MYTHGHERKNNGRRHIFISAGTMYIDQRIVVVHEMAHRIVTTETHGVRYWRKLIELCRRHHIPARYMLMCYGDRVRFQRAYQKEGGRL